MPEDILTVDEAAQLLKIAPQAVLDLLMSSDLPGRNLGGEWRTTRRALIGFIDGLDQAGGCCGPGMCCPPVAATTKPAAGWS